MASSMDEKAVSPILPSCGVSKQGGDVVHLDRPVQAQRQDQRDALEKELATHVHSITRSARILGAPYDSWTFVLTGSRQLWPGGLCACQNRRNSQRGSSDEPMRKSSTARAHWRPSRMAQTASDRPRRRPPPAAPF